MILIINLIIAGYFLYLSIYAGTIIIYIFLFLSLVNIVYAYNVLSENKRLKKEKDSQFLKVTDLTQDNFNDPLTGLYNRRYFDLVLSKFIKKAAKYNIKFSVLMLDIDHFKKFNDTYGHDVGDKVLKIVSSTVKEHIRGNQDILFRYGGEEFVIISMDDLTGAITLAKKINSLEFKGSPEKITVSIGISSYKQGEDVVKLADDNLYKAKEAGRNCFKY
ncbi:MAG: GGDEF domain-containing protein [Candidatus Acididesulfobacter guangdongensis]|uniref:GGDEF domain-containing protein n=1 Tax=Acididesulfobacter guangdongensis TaxID=2597225 RepID=A0A519BH81_ACIG2|nr:MAG: GGDEF domain-containing protein [Candidatus Acididesulfobacter guangdongensis]